MLNYDIECPKCKVIIHLPFMRLLEAKAVEDFDFLEMDAQTKWNWISHASLWQLFKFWWVKRYKG